ncbi:MAG TPA: hypothetical protein VJ979_02580 [Actinomycetota bacterium]|nr:hypothetical protein [Actinomycetota bacterium]
MGKNSTTTARWPKDSATTTRSRRSRPKSPADRPKAARRADAERKAQAQAEAEAKAKTIAGKIETLQAQLAQAEASLAGIERKPARPGAPPELTVVRDGEGNPVGAAEASVVANAERADAWMKAQQLREQIADLEKRQAYESIADTDLIATVEDLEIERESYRIEARKAAEEGRYAAERKAKRLMQEASDKFFPMAAERDTRKRDANMQASLEQLALKRAKSLRHQRLQEWKAREAELDQRFGGVKAKDYPNFDFIDLVEAQNQVELLQGLIAKDAPISKEEIAAAQESVRSSVTVQAPNIAEGTW